MADTFATSRCSILEEFEDNDDVVPLSSKVVPWDLPFWPSSDSDTDSVIAMSEDEEELPMKIRLI